MKVFLRTWTFHFHRFGTLSVITHSKSLYFGALTPRWILLPFTHTYPTTHTHSEKPEKKEKNRKEILICSGLMAGVSFEVKIVKYWFKVRAQQTFYIFFIGVFKKSIFCLSSHVRNKPFVAVNVLSKWFFPSVSLQSNARTKAICRKLTKKCPFLTTNKEQL